MRLFLILCLALVGQSGALAHAHEKRDAQALSRFIMGQLYENRGEPAKAINEYKAVVKLDPGNPRAHLGLASSYIRNSDFPKAIEELTLVSRLDPESVEPHAVLALLYSVQRKPELADKEYERALENFVLEEPGNTDVIKALGAVYLGQRRLEDAERMYRKALVASPKDPELYFYLGGIADQRNDPAGVVANLKKAIEYNPEYHEALNYLGYYYVERGEHLDEAEAMIRKALSLDPENGAYVDSLGWLEFKTGKLQEALPLLKKADALLDDPVISDHAGDAFFKAGDRRQALRYWEKSLRLDPQQREVKKKLESTHEHE